MEIFFVSGTAMSHTEHDIVFRIDPITKCDTQKLTYFYTDGQETQIGRRPR